jgi:hypothetical protein
LYLAVELEREA